MKFNERYKEIMAESLLEGNADYSDVMDAAEKLKVAIERFISLYPASNPTHIHGQYKAELESICSRLDSWCSRGSVPTESTPPDLPPTDTAGSLTTAG